MKVTIEFLKSKDAILSPNWIEQKKTQQIK